MPFKSEAQRRHLYATDPELAARFERDTPPGPLPDHIEPDTKAKRRPTPVRPPKVRKIKRAGR